LSYKIIGNEILIIDLPSNKFFPNFVNNILNDLYIFAFSCSFIYNKPDFSGELT